jgi:hypothetical protein
VADKSSEQGEKRRFFSQYANMLPRHSIPSSTKYFLQMFLFI